MARLPNVVTGDKNVWGMVLNEFLAVSHNEDGTLVDGLTWRSVKDPRYGAVGDGVADDTAAIQAAIDAAAAAGGGTVFLSPGTYALTGPVDVPAYVNLMGAGDGHTAAATTLLCADATAQLAFGERGVSSYGGVSGGFRIDANTVATTPMYCGQTIGRTFQNVTVYDGAAGGALLLIEEMQNSRFFGLNLMNGRGDHLVLDRGCAGNHFFGFESSNAGATAGVHLRFQATAAAPVGLVAYPFNNHFWGGILERLDAGGTGIVHYGAGDYNQFHSVQLAITGKVVPVVKVEITDPTFTPFVTLVLDNVHIQDNSNQATALDVDDTADVDVYGKLVINNTEYAYRLRDATSRINFRGGSPELAGVTTTLDPASVGTLNGVLIRPESAKLIYTAPALADVVAVYAVAGEAGERFRITPAGIQANDGSDFTPDTTFLRSGSTGVGGFVCNKPLIGQSVWSSGVTTKTAAYTTLIGDDLILCDSTSGSFTVTLLSAVFTPGKEYTIKRTAGANNVTVDGNGTQTIDGALTKVLGSIGAAVTIRTDGANWRIVSQVGTVT